MAYDTTIPRMVVRDIEDTNEQKEQAEHEAKLDKDRLSKVDKEMYERRKRSLFRQLSDMSDALLGMNGYTWNGKVKK